ncbi:hypothetical protein ACFU9F_36455 [Streptomyces zhihengii]|uniref:hypothetical protein n=1 Tax=Streptomyces zhihengii TaxID=1818004 RepID=UPI0036970CC9
MECGKLVFGMSLPACLVEAVRDRSWMSLASSPRLEAVFGYAPVHPRFHAFSGMVGVTEWWRGLDEEMAPFYGASDDPSAPGHMSRTSTVIIGNLGPDLPFALDYRESPADPSVAFLGEGDHWQRVSGSVSDLILALDPLRAGDAPAGTGATGSPADGERRLIEAPDNHRLPGYEQSWTP